MGTIAEFISRNAYLVITTFVVSLFANILQITTYLRDKRRIREEASERDRLASQLEKYRYIVGLAERNIKTEEQLEQIENDITKRKTAAKDIEDRIVQMRDVAQRQIVKNAIELSVRDLVSSYEDVRALRSKFRNLGVLPDIPTRARAEIEREVSVAIRKPYELPKAFVFRALLLLLLAILLPWPVNTVITLIFLHIFFALFFEAAEMYPDPRVSGWVFRHAQAIGRWSAVGLWYVLLNFIQNLVAVPVENIFKSEYTWSISEVLTVTAAVLGGLLHWRAVGELALAGTKERTPTHTGA